MAAEQSTRAIITPEGDGKGYFQHIMVPDVGAPTGFRSRRVEQDWYQRQVNQVAYVDPATGNDSTGKINDSNFKFATMRAAVDSFYSPVAMVLIEDGADLVETQNVLDGISDNVQELHIFGQWNSMELQTTRPFNLTVTNIKNFSINRSGGVGDITSTSSSFTVIVEAWPGSSASNVNLNVGNITFNASANHRVAAFNSVDLNFSAVIESISNGSIATSRLGSGDIKFRILGDCTAGPSSGNTESVMEIRDGDYSIDIEVNGSYDINPLSNIRAGFFRSQAAANNNHKVSIKSDISDDVARIFGVMHFQGGKLVSYFSYSGNISGSGSGALIRETDSAGNYGKTVSLHNVRKQTPGELFYKSGTGSYDVFITNSTCEDTPINLETTADIGRIYINGLYVEGSGALLFSTNSVDTKIAEVYVMNAMVNSLSTSASEVFEAASATGIVADVLISTLSTNIGTVADPAKFDVTQFSSSSGFVKADGTVPFTAPQEGVSPVSANDLTTKSFVESLVSDQENQIGLAFEFDHAAGLTPSNQEICFDEQLSGAFSSLDMTAVQEIYMNQEAVNQRGFSAFLNNLYTSGDMTGGYLVIKWGPFGTALFKVDSVSGSSVATFVVTHIFDDGNFEIGEIDGTYNPNDVYRITVHFIPNNIEGAIESVNGQTPTAGSVTLETQDIPEGTGPQYHTTQRANEAVWQSGTVFPTTPFDYQHFFRTDLGTLFYWDASRSKWLTVETISFTASGLSNTFDEGINLQWTNGNVSRGIPDDKTFILVGVTAEWLGTNPGAQSTPANLTVRIIENIVSASNNIDLAYTNKLFGLNDMNIDEEVRELVRVQFQNIVATADGITSLDLNRPNVTLHFKIQET